MSEDDEPVVVSRHQSTDPRQMMSSSRVLVATGVNSVMEWRLERGRLPSSAAFTFVCSFSICVVLVVVVILGLGPFY